MVHVIYSSTNAYQIFDNNIEIKTFSTEKEAFDEIFQSMISSITNEIGNLFIRAEELYFRNNDNWLWVSESESDDMIESIFCDVIRSKNGFVRGPNDTYLSWEFDNYDTNIKVKIEGFETTKYEWKYIPDTECCTYESQSTQSIQSIRSTKSIRPSDHTHTIRI